MRFTGTQRVPSTHAAFPGVHGTPRSRWGHLVRTAATPLLGAIVVNGNGAIGTSSSVSALKNVDLPTFGFPTTPISMCANPGLLRVIDRRLPYSLTFVRPEGQSEQEVTQAVDPLEERCRLRLDPMKSP